jgi:hypothetical protein
VNVAEIVTLAVLGDFVFTVAVGRWLARSGDPARR